MLNPRVLIVTNSSDYRDSLLWIKLLRKNESIDFVGPAPKDLATSTTWTAEFENRTHLLRSRSPASHSSMWLSGLPALLSDRTYDLVHFVFEPWSLIPSFLGNRITYVIHGAENVIVDAPRTLRLRRVGIRRVLNNAGGVAAWGQTSMNEFLAIRNAIPVPTLVFPSSPPVRPLEDSIPRRIENQRLRIGAYGRLIPEKGFHTLLDAIQMPGLEKAEVRIMGDGRDRQRLKNHKTVSEGRAQILSHGDSTAVAKLLAWSDVVVIPSESTHSWKEQWGRTAVESMLADKPTIVANSGELPYIQPDLSLQFMPGDAFSLSRILKSFLEDGDELLAASASSILNSRRFHLDVLAEQVETFWNQIHTNKTSN